MFRIFKKDPNQKDMLRALSKVEKAVKKGIVQNRKLARNAGISSNDVNALFSAIEECDIKKVRKLLSDKPQLATFKDIYGKTALHHFTFKYEMNDLENQIVIAKTLLDYGADINSKDNFRSTPIYSAIHSTNVTLVRILIERGANLHTSNKAGVQPIHMVRGKDMLDILLGNGVDINARTNDNETLLARYLLNHLPSDKFAVYIKSRGGTL